MITRIVFGCLFALLSVAQQAQAQTDPTLAGMILAYTDKAEDQLKAQEKAMMMQTTGHLWIREEVEATTDLQRQYNEYLDSFRDIICYAAQIYGFYHEVGKLSDTMGELNKQLRQNGQGAFAVALTPRRNRIYRDLILGSVEIVNDIWQVCLSDTKMTEKQCHRANKSTITETNQYLMNTPQQSQRFAEIEFCLQRYFNSQLDPVMRNVRQELSEKQAKEYGDYATSVSGILRSAAGSMNHVPDDSMQYLKLTGEWNSKTAEDYVEMCREQISASKDIQKDLERIADEWRNTVVAEIGRERYDTLSKELGSDLAFAYVDYRVEQMMIDKMVADKMPKSSMEYILRKGASESLLGLTQSLYKSPLEEEIERKGEAAYHPDLVEKGAGKAVSFGADMIATGGLTSWASIAKLLGVEVVFSGVDYCLDKKQEAKSVTIEDCISKGVFGSRQNVFEDFRKRSNAINSWENDYVLSFNNQLTKKMVITTEKPFWVKESEKPLWQPTTPVVSEQNEKAEYAQVPMVVAPGHEQEYLNDVKRRQDMKAKETQTMAVERPELNSQKDVPEPKTSTNENGWGNFLGSVGLDGLGDIGKNLGYVVSMLPDMLIGLFTGKTKSLNIQNSMIPVASILIGMFVRNPLLKMVLIGMGGLNLLNKAGREAMDKQEGRTQQNVGPVSHYKTYSDEPLNPRIGNPALQGNCLIATIDKVPCSIQLPTSVVAAYQAGALPLNTLSNAVLAKNDELRAMARENYEISQSRNGHSRGIY